MITVLALVLALGAHGTLVSRAAPPDYAALVSGAGQIRSLQGRPFRFTLGGGDDNPAVVRTRQKIAMADAGFAGCGVAEWGYSFHYLRNGEADGAGHKQFGGYPTPPRSRAEAMAAVRRYFLSQRAEALQRARPEERGCVYSINGHYCYQHYACEWGCDVVGSEVGENINSIQAHIAFTRGAARQYGKPWLIDFSSWYGPSIFDEDPRRTWGDNSGSEYGHSLSLHARTYYTAFMAGANIVIAEGGWLNGFRSQTPGADGMLPLSALGREMAAFHRYAQRHPDRGVPYAPVAVVLPFDHGLYPGFGAKESWHAFPYMPGDQSTLDTLNVFFPGSLGDPDQPERADRQPADPTWTDPDYMHTESLRLVASPYGDIVDVLLANAHGDVLRGYPLLVAAGEFTPDPDLAGRLRAYVEGGGTLVLGDRQRRQGLLPAAILARLHVPPVGGCARMAYGRGAVIALAPDQPGTPTAEHPLAKLLARAARELIPFRVSGRVETLFNRTADGWIVTVVNDEGVTKTPREPVRIDPRRAQTVRLTYRGTGAVRRATLWGSDADSALNPADIRVVVPPGEVRVVRVTIER